MKTLFKFVLVVVCLSVFSCKKDEATQPVSSGSSSITSDGKLSGVISNNSTSLVDSIVLVEANYLPLGKCKVPTTGSFTITLGIPTVLEKIGKSPVGVVCSDTTAMSGEVDMFVAYKKGIETGVLVKGNNATLDTPKAGDSRSMFVYFDRAITINGTGTEISNDTIPAYNGSIQQIIKTTATTNYSNVKMNKGWNELVMTTNSLAVTATTATISATFSNTIPTNVKWTCISFPSFVKAQVPARKLTNFFLDRLLVALVNFAR